LCENNVVKYRACILDRDTLRKCLTLRRYPWGFYHQIIYRAASYLSEGRTSCRDLAMKTRWRCKIKQSWKTREAWWFLREEKKWNLRYSDSSAGTKARQWRKNKKCVRANCAAQHRQATRDGDTSFSINQK